LASDRHCEIVARVGRAESERGLSAAVLNGAQVAIEFSQPETAVANAVACLRAHCPVVIGTTGWSESMGKLAETVAHNQCSALWSPNFSLGVQLFLAVATEAARRFCKHREFEAGIVETHHSAKKDAPSGTAIAVRDQLREGGLPTVPITSIRLGSVPGTHEIVFDAPFEQVRLTHEARDRRVFADGALVAARWLAQTTTPGLYTMRDVINS
ncbi:MAG: hypothetical protein M3Y64_09235, partial [Gemmatimonadota bacterium]|nr:hypothetical protein [Gemmatimonadota bacterium]